jgi:hypothetical protein
MKLMCMFSKRGNPLVVFDNYKITKKTLYSTLSCVNLFFGTRSPLKRSFHLRFRSMFTLTTSGIFPFFSG